MNRIELESQDLNQLNDLSYALSDAGTSSPKKANKYNH